MSENKKDLVLENVKGDSVKTDVKVDEYVMATKLTAEEIAKLPKGRVIMKKTEGKTQSGEVFKRFSLQLDLASGSIFNVESKRFQESDFYYLALNVFHKKYNDSIGLNVYDRKFPIRFIKGNYKNKDGEVNEYHMIQIIFKVGVVYSIIIRNTNRELETLLTNEEFGFIPKINWVIKPGVGNVVNDNGEYDNSSLYNE